MLTHIAHLITLPRFASARRPSQFKIKYVASPASVVFTHVIVQEKKPFVIVAPFLLPSPYFYAVSPGLVGINLLIYLNSPVFCFLCSLFILLYQDKLTLILFLGHHCPFSAFLTLFCYCFTRIN